MKKSFMTRALATGLSLAMAFSLSAATNVTVASAASTPAMIATRFAVRVGGATKTYKVSTATRKTYNISKAVVGNTDKATVKVAASKKGIKVTPGTVAGSTVITVTFKNIKTKKTTSKKYRCYVLDEIKDVQEPVEEALAISEVKQIASNQIKVVFNKDASANAKDTYKIAATDGTKEIGVKTVTYSEDGKSALIDTYTNVDNGVVYNVSCGELTASFTASVGEVASIAISTVNAQQNVKTPINFTLFDANGIDVTPSVDVDSTCVITLDGSYVTAEKEKASEASVTMGTVGDTVNVTITYNKGVTGSEAITQTQAITCVAAGQTLGTAVFVSSDDINNNSECAKFYLGLSDKLVTVKENNSETNIFFCAKDSSGNVISYDKYDVESSNDDVATVTVTKDSGKYMQLTVNGNSVGTANLNVSASKNGVATAYSIPVQVSKGTTAVKMVATASEPVMSNVKDNEYSCEINAKLLDANGKEVDGTFTYSVSKVVSEDKEKISVTDTGIVSAVGATPGTYAVKVTGSENKDGSYAFEQNVSITVKALPDAAYDPDGSGIKVTYKVALSNTTVDENPTDTSDDSTEARLYAVYNGLFAGYVNQDGSVSDEDDNGLTGIVIAESSKITTPKVTVKFGNQYFTPSANAVNLFAPSTNAATATIKDGTETQLAALADDAADLTISSVDTTSDIVYGDVTSDGTSLWTCLGRTGTYTVEYYYTDADGEFVTKPISGTFTVANTLTIPTVTVTTKKVASFTEAKLIEVLKASVDMNNNTSDYMSIAALANGWDADSSSYVSGTLSSDGLKITYKYAIVEDNFDNGTWLFYVPINTTFSYQ